MYAHAIDLGQLDDLYEVFANNGSITLVGDEPVFGPAAIVAALEGKRGNAVSQHIVGSATIDVADTHTAKSLS